MCNSTDLVTYAISDGMTNETKIDLEKQKKPKIGIKLPKEKVHREKIASWLQFY